jgi:hypothetical protein
LRSEIAHFGDRQRRRCVATLAAIGGYLGVMIAAV